MARAAGPVQASLELGDARHSGVLEGEVLRVTYENDATGFRVLRVAAGKGEPSTVVGVFPSAPPGTHVRATGRFVEDGKHGRQFKADTLLTLAPSTLDGLKKYLGSGLVPGIGPAYAARIVETFGEGTLEVLDRHPERLREVSGLGARRIGSIAKAWTEHRDVGAIMVFLQAHGASPGLAARIYKRFGPQAIHVVSKSPYRLALDVWGIGFKTADAIARSIGVGRDAPERAQAGVLHTLHELAGRGDVFATREQLAALGSELLECDQAAVTQAIGELARAARVELESLDDGTTLVFTPELHRAEVRVAERLHALLTAARPLGAVDRAVADFEKRAGVALADAQRHAIVEAARSKVLVITGGPGVGKTTVVRAILALFDHERMRVALAAPTGRAAKRMAEATGREAATLHRLLEYDPKGARFERNLDDPLEVDAVVVDEASMLALELADALLAAIPDRARLVLVGDVDQLPSVGPGAVLRDIIASGRVATVRLTQIFRQAEGSAIVTNAHRILVGEPPIGSEQKDGQFYLIDRREPEAARELIRELVQKRVPRGFGLDPIWDVQVLTPMQKGTTGAIALNEMLQEALNPAAEGKPEVRRGTRVLRDGDKVMQLRNNYDKEVFNGDVGCITGVAPAERKLTVRFDDRLIDYGEGDLDELSLAYATSIHKSQGSEYPAVIVPLLTQHFVMLSRNLLYTAVTRGRRLCVLVADPRALGIALAEVRKEERRTRLCERLRGRS